jgi:D-3-phosphoglycerate dehydrogenase
MKPNILVCDGMDKEIFEQLQSNDFFDVHPSPKNSAEKINELRSKAHGVVIRSATNIDKNFIDGAPNLKYVIRAGEGTDNIDKAYCQQKGIKVSNTPGANNNSAAEHAVALTLSLLRHIPAANSSMKEGKWDKASFTGNELWKKKVGIFGFGRIGQLYAKRISGFEPEIFFYDPSMVNHGVEYKNITKANSLEDLFSKCDVISIHVPLNEKTKNSVNKSLLSKMKDGAILINAARGNIINEQDLVECLRSQNIKVALDTFASEPLEKGDALQSDLPNLILTPHLGGSTEEAQLRVGQMSYDQLVQFFVEGQLLHEVRI